MDRNRFVVILVRPEKPENVGLVARNMKNTGFTRLRLVAESLDEKSFSTAVHSRDILEKAALYPSLLSATEDLNLVFATTSEKRKNFTLFSLEEALARMMSFPASVKIGLLFGNERTGLTSDELRFSNFCFTIPQARRQPSYNLASAVLLTLFHIYRLDSGIIVPEREKPLTKKQQQECIELILSKLEQRKFLHAKTKAHVSEMVYDLFGRLTLSEKDKRLLLAVFSKSY